MATKKAAPAKAPAAKAGKAGKSAKTEAPAAKEKSRVLKNLCKRQQSTFI